MSSLELRNPPTCGNSWKVKDINWRELFNLQTLLLIFVIPVSIVAVAIVDSLDVYKDRPFLVYDATLSYPYVGASTVPYWVAGVVPYLLVIFSVLIGELLIAQHKNLTIATAAILHYILDALLAALITSLFTIVTKITVGRLRPDYLALCQPSLPSNIRVAYGLGSSSNPECTNGSDMHGREIDGHWSFPSGHASTAFSLATYCVVYVMYTVYWRRSWSLHTNTNNMIFTKKRLYLEVAHSVVLLYIMCIWALAWGIAASRITDYKHHPSDVVAGAFLGILITCTVIARGIAIAPGSRLATSLGQGSGESTPTRRLMDQQ